MADQGTQSSLATAWTRAATMLGLDLVAPFVVSLPSGAKVEAPVLVPRFGAQVGMLLVADYATVSPYINELVGAGFGFSVLDEPPADAPLVLEEYVAVLQDWGWTGPPEDAPAWAAIRDGHP